MSHRGEYLRFHGSSSCAYIRFVYLIPMKYQYINLTYKLQPFVVAWLGQHQQWHHKALSSMRWYRMSNSSSLRDGILLPTVGSSFCESHADQYLPLLACCARYHPVLKLLSIGFIFWYIATVINIWWHACFIYSLIRKPILSLSENYVTYQYFIYIVSLHHS
jgi:hypothetical protein